MIDLIGVAEETKEISKYGSYSIGSRTFSFNTADNTTIYTDDDFAKLDSMYSQHLNKDARIKLKKEGTVDTVFAVSDRTNSKKVGVLNFASAYHPGGGFENGAVAQEECLAYCSDLFMKQTGEVGKKFYEINRAYNKPFYTDTMLFSDVTFFRNSRYELVPFNVRCGVLTCPAVNIGALCTEDVEHGYDIMCERMRKILIVFRDKGCKTIILGAFGCGVFGNNPNVVANYWKELLFDEGFIKDFEQVIFSIFDRSATNGNFEIFKKVFSI